MAKRAGSKDAVKIMVVSEFPVDSVIGTSQASQFARQGILTYAALEKPDLIFVDGLISNQKDPEILIPSVRDRETLEQRIYSSIDVAAVFLEELSKASPSSKIYVAKTDEDEYNCTLLDKGKAKQKKVESEGRGGLLEEELKLLEEEIKEARAMGQRRKLQKLSGQKGAIQQKLYRMEKAGKYQQPKRGSPERVETRKEAFDDYYGRLQELVPSVQVSRQDTIQVTVGEVLIEYVHNGGSGSGILGNRGSSALRGIKERLSAGESVPDILIEGGHHAESYAEPIRRKNSLNEPIDKYTLLVSSMVMEDQEMVSDIMDGSYEPELFDGVAKNFEAVKRASKKNPPAGVVIVGRDESGYFQWPLRMSHLIEVGKKKVDPQDTTYNKIFLLSDLHVGKGTTRYDALRSMMEIAEREVEERHKAGQSTPAFFLLNEALQGYNYDTFPVELSRTMPDDVKRNLESSISALQKSGLPSEKLVERVIALATQTHEEISMVRIEDQWKFYNDLLNRVLFKALIYATLSPDAAVDPVLTFFEANHVAKSVGKWGITEVGLQTVPIREADRAIQLLSEMGMLSPKAKMTPLVDRIRSFEEGIISSYGSFEFKTGDQVYSVVAEHKPGSGTPQANAKQKQIARGNLRADSFDFYFAGHQHYPAVAQEGLIGSNDSRDIVKGATFAEHDSYGKAGDWAPPSIGVVEVLVSENKGPKRPPKYYFRLSDVLIDKKE